MLEAGKAGSSSTGEHSARARAFVRARSRYFILFFGAMTAGTIGLMPTPEGLTTEGQRALAIMALCIILWVSQAIPLMITSLLAIVLFPLAGVMTTEEVYPFFANQAVFFILGAFMLASAILRSGLSSRITLGVLRRFGRSPRSLLASVMLIPAALSCVMPEHAVAAMFFPVTVEITRSLDLRPGESRYAKSLYIALAWGAVIGGITTFLGGARAPLAIGILQANTGESIGFLPWTLAALPTVLIMLGVGYLVLTRVFPPDIESVAPAIETIRQRVASQGAISRREIEIALIMVGTIAAWVLVGEHLGLANIALAAVAIAFALGLMKWKEVEEDVNWGVFLMYGGAIALSFALSETGAATWLVDVTVASFPHSAFLIVASVALLSNLLTEAMSNTAVVALVLPVALTFAAAQGLPPQVMTLVVTIPSGLAFMLPMGTPANAIAYSSGYIQPSDTIRAGAIMLVTSWVTFVTVAMLWWPIIGFGF